MVVPTIHDDVGILVGNETLDSCNNLIGRQMQCARQMILPVIRLGQHLEERKLVASFDLQAQLFT